MLESKFKLKQREELEALGWKFVQFSNEAGRGFPDTLCLAPNGYHCFVEWKKSKNSKKQPLQNYWRQKLGDMNHDAFFVSPETVWIWREQMFKKGGKDAGNSRV